MTGVLIKVDIEGRPGRQLQRAARRKIESAPAGAYVEGKWYHKRAGAIEFEQYPEPVSAQIEAARLDGEGLVEVTPGCHVELKETKAPQAKKRFFQQVSSAALCDTLTLECHRAKLAYTIPRSGWARPNNHSTSIIF